MRKEMSFEILQLWCSHIKCSDHVLPRHFLLFQAMCAPLCVQNAGKRQMETDGANLKYDVCKQLVLFSSVQTCQIEGIVVKL